MELTHVNYFLSLKFLSLQILRIFLCCYSIFILSQNAVSLHFLTKNMPILYKQVTESRNNRALEARFFFCTTSRKSYKKQKESNYVHLTYFDQNHAGPDRFDLCLHGTIWDQSGRHGSKTGPGSKSTDPFLDPFGSVLSVPCFRLLRLATPGSELLPVYGGCPGTGACLNITLRWCQSTDLDSVPGHGN